MKENAFVPAFTSPSVRSILEREGLAPNKALGQNFLVDQNAIESILTAAEIEHKAVLEIGPGLGALTEGLLARAQKLAAVEIDRHMCEYLRARFGDSLLLYHADFLKANLSAIHAALGGGSLCIVGNLPYYVTTPICMRLFESELPIESMTLMLQSEAAERFSAPPSSRVYGPMSVLAQLYYEIEDVLSLSPASYYPQPEVSSRVIRLVRNDRALCPSLPRLLQACFHMRRKTLYNNLKAFSSDAGKINEALMACGISPQARAESLPPESFLSLAQELS